MCACVGYKYDQYCVYIYMHTHIGLYWWASICMHTYIYHATVQKLRAKNEHSCIEDL